MERKYAPKFNESSEHIWNETVGELGTEYEDTLDVEEQILKVLNKLYGKENSIIGFSEKYNLQSMLMIVITMNDGYTPALVINKKIIDFVHNIGAEIHFDLYANPYQFY